MQAAVPIPVCFPNADEQIGVDNQNIRDVGEKGSHGVRVRQFDDWAARVNRKVNNRWVGRPVERQ